MGGVEAVNELQLCVSCHEHIPLLEAHQQRPQNLANAEATLVGVPDDAESSQVYDHLPALPLHEVLQKEEERCE